MSAVAEYRVLENVNWDELKPSCDYKRNHLLTDGEAKWIVTGNCCNTRSYIICDDCKKDGERRGWYCGFCGGKYMNVEYKPL